MKRTPLKRGTSQLRQAGFTKKSPPLTRKTASRRRATPKPKKVPIKKLKARLWALCREIQIKKYGRNCYTCGARELIGSNCHLGHFIPSSICSVEIRYSLDNLRPCCYHCNINLSGNWIAYEVNLIKEHGEDFVKNLKNENNRTKGGMFREDWYENKINEYTRILGDMETNSGT